ncbi:MAG: CPBP family intramembrane glutamic endopeptidase [Bacteroidales bacterium]
MKKILSEILDYHRRYFHLSLFITIALFLAVLIAFNYLFDFEDDYIDKLPQAKRMVGLFLYQGLPYLVICLLLYFFNIQRTWIRSSGFWLRFIIGFLILAFSRSYTRHHWLTQLFSGIDLIFARHVMHNLWKFFALMIPLVVFYLVADRHKTTRLYGLVFNRFSARPYFIILGIALVCIGIGSFFRDIQDYYPLFYRYRGHVFAEVNNWPLWTAILTYEIPYALDFINVEFFFRGFLVVGFTRYLGPHAVLPMVAAYCALHFGKPMTEAISSIFGGYILGVISYHSRTIWGGAIIHAGTAWAMEIVGFLWRLA